jgi:DnaJ domain
MIRALRSARWKQLRSFVQQQNVFQDLQKRFITIQDARDILGVSHVRLTPKLLRTAYLEAAKRCHPDTQTEKKSKHDTGEEFRQVTEAYEVLLGTNMPNFTNDFGITDSEEAEFRRACQDMLGVRAEVVEESKRCPAFRQWLAGRTDAAYTWRAFFMRYGGFAPKLRPSAGMIEASKAELPKSSSRRRRSSRSTNA